MIVYKTQDRNGYPALISPCIKELGSPIDYAYAGIFDTEEDRERFITEKRCIVRTWRGN